MTNAPPLSLTGWLRYDVVQRLLPAGEHRLLEIGAGLGGLGARLSQRFDYTGLEPDPTSFVRAERAIGKHGEILNCAIEGLPATDVFDIVCAFEVLEHLEDDRGALELWLRHVRSDGWFVASVPAGRDRFSRQDEYVGHHRRYDREDFASLLVEAGLEDIVLISYGFPLGNVLEKVRSIFARKRTPSEGQLERTTKSGRWLQPPDWAGIATRGLTFPFRLVQRPFASTHLGTGFVARGRKRAPDLDPSEARI